jgi:branched-chain amino acid aminotransferase
MLSIDWDAANGWHKPEIKPYGPIEVATTATVLHYGISVYEGIGSCKNAETGKPQAFRAKEHL